MDKKTKIGLWLCRGPALLFAVLEARGCLRHYHEDWNHHAQFHQLTGLSYYLCSVLFFMWITGKPFKNKEKWAWYALPCMGIFVHGSHILVDFFTHGLRGGGTSQGSGMMFFYMTIAGLVFYLIGSALTFKYFKKED